MQERGEERSVLKLPSYRHLAVKILTKQIMSARHKLPVLSSLRRMVDPAGRDLFGLSKQTIRIGRPPRNGTESRICNRVE
jgi:hypothetical protein